MAAKTAPRDAGAQRRPGRQTLVAPSPARSTTRSPTPPPAATSSRPPSQPCRPRSRGDPVAPPQPPGRVAPAAAAVPDAAPPEAPRSRRVWWAAVAVGMVLFVVAGAGGAHPPDIRLGRRSPALRFHPRSLRSPFPPPAQEAPGEGALLQQGPADVRCSWRRRLVASWRRCPGRDSALPWRFHEMRNASRGSACLPGDRGSRNGWSVCSRPRVPRVRPPALTERVRLTLGNRHGIIRPVADSGASAR